ncbi:MAG: type II secretion system major pseudopilin GspG [Candidatus Binatia bacterium]
MIYRSEIDRDRDKDRESRPRGRCFSLSLSEISVCGGFTLVELLVVMVIIGLLAALVVPPFVRQEEKAKVKTAKAQIELLGTALDTFRLDVGRYPTTQEGLEALRRKAGSLERWDGPYLKKEVPLDPWGKSYVYRSPGEHGPYDLLSYGADGAPGGEGDNRDLTSWEG